MLTENKYNSFFITLYFPKQTLTIKVYAMIFRLSIDRGNKSHTSDGSGARYVPITVVILNIGRNIAMTTDPITIPKNAIIRGSMMLVRPLTAISTCSS